MSQEERGKKRSSPLPGPWRGRKGEEKNRDGRPKEGVRRNSEEDRRSLNNNKLIMIKREEGRERKCAEREREIL